MEEATCRTTGRLHTGTKSRSHPLPDLSSELISQAELKKVLQGYHDLQWHPTGELNRVKENKKQKNMSILLINVWIVSCSKSCKMLCRYTDSW